jgi:hypothetical protein
MPPSTAARQHGADTPSFATLGLAWKLAGATFVIITAIVGWTWSIGSERGDAKSAIVQQQQRNDQQQKEIDAHATQIKEIADRLTLIRIDQARELEILHRLEAKQQQP